jgi:hypothetical protein
MVQFLFCQQVNTDGCSAPASAPPGLVAELAA